MVELLKKCNLNLCIFQDELTLYTCMVIVELVLPLHAGLSCLKIIA
jgi:hypothetical protein